jgi:hypothetical protein
MLSDNANIVLLNRGEILYHMAIEICRNLHTFMYFLPTILPCSGRYSGQRVHKSVQNSANFYCHTVYLSAIQQWGFQIAYTICSVNSWLPKRDFLAANFCQFVVCLFVFTRPGGTHDRCFQPVTRFLPSLGQNPPVP